MADSKGHSRASLAAASGHRKPENAWCLCSGIYTGAIDCISRIENAFGACGVACLVGPIYLEALEELWHRGKEPPLQGNVWLEMSLRHEPVRVPEG